MKLHQGAFKESIAFVEPFSTTDLFHYNYLLNKLWIHCHVQSSEWKWKPIDVSIWLYILLLLMFCHVNNNLPVLLIYVPFGQISQLKQHLWIPFCFFACPTGHSGEHSEVGTCTRQVFSNKQNVSEARRTVKNTSLCCKKEEIAY